jgi:D-cysteine desulfhydrase
MESPLFAAFPALEGQVPWIPLGRFPTRVHRLARLGADTGARELWVKRDDESGERYGGNKVRKLEHLLADARARGATSVHTVGGVGSNLTVATAIYARELGFKVRATVVPHELDAHARQNVRVALAAGVSFDVLRAQALLPFRMAQDFARRLASRNGHTPYAFAPGGSSALGTLGYVGAAFELRNQIQRGEVPEPEVIVVALGSGGTFAGLSLGVRLAGLRSRVVGVRVTPRTFVSATSTSLLASRTAVYLKRAGAPVPPALLRPLPLEVIHRFYGGAYGHTTPASRDAVERARSLESLELENTYTGKALAGLLDLIRREQLYHRPVLFWNTVNSVDLSALAADAPKRETLGDDLRRFLDE